MIFYIIIIPSGSKIYLYFDPDSFNVPKTFSVNNRRCFQKCFISFSFLLICIKSAIFSIQLNRRNKLHLVAIQIKLNNFPIQEAP